MGTAQVGDHSHRVRNHQWSEHARGRPRFGQAPGTEAHREARNDVPDRLLRGGFRVEGGQGSCGEQQGCESAGSVQRGDCRHVPRTQRESSRRLVGSALFGDGAAVYVVGSDPKPEVEKAVFEVHWAGETILPESDGAIDGHLTEAGLIFHLMKDVPGLISKNIEKFLNEARKAAGSPQWNEMFWAVHPGGPAILDQVEAKLKLTADKLQGSRDILSEYGNMSSSSVLFVLDQIRHRSMKMGSSSTGEGNEYGFLIGFGPGLTLEVLLLRSVPTAAL